MKVQRLTISLTEADLIKALDAVGSPAESFMEANMINVTEWTVDTGFRRGDDDFVFEFEPRTAGEKTS